MKLNSMDRISILACVTGLALLAIFFGSVGIGVPQPDWLPMVIASIAGFELFMMVDALRRSRMGGGLNG